MAQKKQPETRIEKALPIEWSYPPELQSHFVTNIVVQHQADHFILAFFEVWPPVILSDAEEEAKREIAKLKKVDAVCVARVVATPQKMREFIAIMSTNLERYEKTFSARRKEGE